MPVGPADHIPLAMSLYDDPDTSLDAAYPDDDASAQRAADAGGLGSLADELADLMGDSGSEGELEDDEYEDRDTTSTSLPTNGTLSPSKDRRARRPSESDSDPGDDELDEQLSAIENLAIRSRVEMREEAEDTVVLRVMDGLQNLLPQTQLEAASSRLTTAHSALSSHMMRSAASLRDLSFAISSSSLPPDDTGDLLLSLIDLMPRPALHPLAELSTLHGLTLKLVDQLSLLSDALHMARQSSMAASRKLRVVKEACADWKHELEMVEKARRWIEEGDWEGRCRRREAAVVCKEVTGGFEDVCRGFEEQLRAQDVGA